MADINEMYAEAEKLKDEGKNQEAIAKLNEVLAQDESHVLSHLALAVLHFKEKDAEKSVAHGKKACELEPNEAFNFTALSVTYQRAFQLTQDHQYIHLAEEAMAKAHSMQ